MKSFLTKYKVSSIIISIITLLGGTGYVSSLVIRDMPIYKNISKAYDTSLKVDSIQKVNSIRINYVFKYIKNQEKKKKEEYQVGLRFKKINEKLYFRDKHREYREIKTDLTGDYYRDDSDRKVYINDKI